ncbi:MAG: hypothetical protein V3V13_12265 [Paracoccaceae bacterium]
MTELSDDQNALRASIRKGAITWGVIIGVLTALLAYWLLGAQGNAVRFGGSGLAGLIAGFGLFKKSFASGAKTARCTACNAAFSITRTDRVETLIASELKEERDVQEDKSTKITTWSAETYDVTDTYTCTACDEVTTKQYQTERKQDEATTIEPFVAPKAGDKQAKSAPKKTARKAGKSKT